MEKITVQKEDLNELMYFIISMFQQENTHIQGTSLKSDLIGGYIDRWINKIPEDIIFNKYLLKEKNYSVINDYFIYNSSSDKNAPDILGLKISDNNIIKFAEFENDTWNMINNMPHIEVKTFKKNQKFISVRDTQLDDNTYYVFVESDFNQDYLINFFDLSMFDNSIHEKIMMNNEFIVSNSQNNIKNPPKIKLQDEIGSLKLINIVKGNDYKFLSNRFEPNEPVYYINTVEEVKSVRGKKDKGRKFSDIFSYDEDREAYCGEWNGNKIIPLVGHNIENLELIKENKKSFYFISKENAYLNDVKSNRCNIKKNKYYKVTLEIFERSSRWTEYIVQKSQFPNKIDKSEELIQIFDKIVDGYRE